MPLKKNPPNPAHAILSLSAQFFSTLGFSRQVVKFLANHIYSDSASKKAFAGYKPTQHDFFAVVHARSGTNWVMMIAQQIAWLGEAEFEHIHHVIPWPEIPVDDYVSLSDMGTCNASPTGKRVIKTHIRAEYIPYNNEASYISVIRDPKDVITSHYHFGLGPAKISHKLSVEEFLDLYLDPTCKGASWAEHTAGFWAWRNRPNVMVLLFSEMKADLPAVINRIAKLMRISLSEEQLSKVMERCGFDYMKSHEYQFAPPVPPFMTEKDNGSIIRSGKVGSSKDLLNQGQRARIDRFYQAELLRLGCDFPYAKHFGITKEQ
ncbi:MAG: sulfotransferase domain-containing protein [Bacteroidetes bacterium]|nr:sulfotransferase domain-containing protein [Bacteroidota bacterium]